MGSHGPQYDGLVLRDRHSQDQASPISYVRRFLGKRFRVLLADGSRQIVGIFVALDSTATLTLRACLEIVEDHERSLGTVMAPQGLIESMETVPDGAAVSRGRSRCRAVTPL
jgi:small nuclear ribonucleoprotein (snRNP)-like protein